jgi:chromosome segregation ATPase
MNEFINILSKFDPANLLAMAAMFWIFKKHLDGKFDKIDKRFERIEEKTEKRFEKIELMYEKIYENFYGRFDKVDSEMREIRTSINRMQGDFYSKDCCILIDK